MNTNRTPQELNELRERCNESIRLNATFYPPVLIKEIGYLACKRWLSGETDVNPLGEIPHNYNRVNICPKYEAGILQALDEVASVEPPKIWIDPEFLEYLEGRDAPFNLVITNLDWIVDSPEWREQSLNRTKRGSEYQKLIDRLDSGLPV